MLLYYETTDSFVSKKDMQTTMLYNKRAKFTSKEEPYHQDFAL